MATSGTLLIRREIFEYGLLPIHQFLPKLEGPAAFQQLLNRLLAAASPTPAPTQYRLGVAVCAECLGLSEAQTRIIVHVLESVLPRNVQGADAEVVDVHTFVLFLLLSSYHRQRRASTNDVWPSNHGDRSPQSSPVAVRSSVEIPDETQQMTWVQKHFGVILPLLRDSPSAGVGGVVTAAEFDRLSLLLTCEDAGAGRPLSSYVSLFAGDGAAGVPTLNEWLVRNTAMPQPPRPPSDDGHVTSAPGRTPSIDRAWCTTLEGLNKTSVIKHEREVRGGAVRLVDCHEAVIYVLAPMQYASLVGCTDCIVVLGAVGRAVKVEHCERMQVITACARVRISGCHDSSFFLGCSVGPMLIGDNRNLKVAPYNTYYERLEADMSKAGLRADVNEWDKWMLLVRDPGMENAGGGSGGGGGAGGEADAGGADADGDVDMTGSGKGGAAGRGGAGGGSGGSMKRAMSALPPDKFVPFIVPFRSAAPSPGGGAGADDGITRGNPWLLPPSYATGLEEKVRSVADLRGRVKEAALEDGRKRELQSVIQSYFKEWLLASGNMRQVYDLARIERGENPSSPG